MKYSDLAIVAKLGAERREVETFVNELKDNADVNVRAYVPGYGSVDCDEFFPMSEGLRRELIATGTAKIAGIDQRLSDCGVKIDAPMEPTGDESIDAVFGLAEAY